MKLRGAFDLKSQVGRGSSEKPSGTVRAQRDLSLGARLAGKFVLARILTHTNTVSAAAIPLRKPTPGRRTEDLNAHLAGLELCADVGVNFAAEHNFFENRSGPSHKLSPLGLEIFPLAEPPGRGVGGDRESYHCLRHFRPGKLADSMARRGHFRIRREPCAKVPDLKRHAGKIQRTQDLTLHSRP